LALNGSEGKFGFVKIADEYSGTAAGNLANYYAGIAYLNTGKYDEAITYLGKFSSTDVMLSALAKGAIGDAYSQKNQPKEALENYIKAAESNKNDFTTPRFLMKAGKVALALGNKEDALKYFTDIKENYENSPEAATVDGLIGLAQ
jgi:tetratricopeptide (TPR) repeat protein